MSITAETDSQNRLQVAHPGVLKSTSDDDEERRYVSYYQWVGFMLFFQVSRALKTAT
jgi:hypothetical protein